MMNNAELVERVTSGRLDLALIGPRNAAGAWPATEDEKLPLIAFEPPCLFRACAAEALDRAGIPWRLAFTSPNLGGLWAATAAGLGLTVRTEIGLPATVRALVPGEDGLPRLPSLSLSLFKAEAEPQVLTARLAEIVLQAVRAALPAPQEAQLPRLAALG